MKIDWRRIIRALTGQPEPPSQPLRDFNSFDELEAWFKLHDELRMEPPNLCDDYSRESRALAEIDGYFLSCHLVDDGMVYTTRIFPEGTWHIANLAIVNKGSEGKTECYYVDLGWNKLVRICDFYSGGKY